MENMAILIDKRIQRFVEGCLYEENGKLSVFI